MTSDMKLQTAYHTIDDLRSLKVQQGREIARLEREIDGLKRTITHLKSELEGLRQLRNPLDAAGVPMQQGLQVGKIDPSRRTCDEYLAKVRELGGPKDDPRADD